MVRLYLNVDSFMMHANVSENTLQQYIVTSSEK
jgi:hypothetical protein